MKTDFSRLPREEIEARITTMLLGEMPADEAAELMDFVSRDSELLKLHDELKRTISLVTEATAGDEAMKLSEGRREQLLESFKMVKPPELAEKTHRKIEWRNWAAMAAMVGLLLGGAAFVLDVPGRFAKARVMAQRTAASKEPEWIGALERPEQEVRRAPQKTVNGSAESWKETDLLADGALDEAKSKLTASMNKTVEKSLKNPAPTKIELPVAQSDAPVKAKNEVWQFQAGQARGFGGYNGGAVRGDGVERGLSYTDAEGKVQATMLPAETPPGIVTVGKDATLAYSDHFGAPAVQPPVQAINGAWNTPPPAADGFFDTSGVVDAKKKDIVAADVIEALPTGSITTSSALTSLTGLPADAAAQPKSAETDAKNSGGEQMGGMGMGGGGSMASMQYYMSNPELMKRYFPQMYSMMQKGRQGGAAPGARPDSSAGLPGRPGLLAQTDEESLERKSEDKPAMQPPIAITPGFPGGTYRYRMPAAPGPYDPMRSLGTPAAKKPETKSQPEQQVALGVEPNQVVAGTELKLLKEDRDGSERQKELADVAKKSELATASVDASGRLPADNDGLIQLKRESLALQPEDAAANEAIRRLPGVVQDAQSLLKLGRTDEAEKKLKDAVKNDPGNRAASYYLDLIKEERYAQEARKHEISMKDSLARVEQSSKDPIARELLPIPNPYANGRVNPGESVVAGRKLTETEALGKEVTEKNERDVATKRPSAPAATPQPEVSTAENAFSTFSLNVSDVSFKLAAASLEKGLMPEAATVRSEEFINAFDYRDPEPQGAPIGFAWERARYPFAQGRDLLRFSVKTAASGRQAGRPLNLVLLLDNSGSMERADRVRILQECLKTLAAQLRPEDRISVVAFARTARLWVDGLPGSQANELAQRVGNLNPEGGTNLEEAMKVAYETARKHFNAGGVNRVVLLTDGAANLGDVEPESLKREVETERKKGIALDCFGIGWEGLNDELLETLSRNGDGRYGFVNTPEAAGNEFAGQLAGALQVAASDVKVQVEWNPKRVTAFRQIGYAKHQLTKEQFRDNTVDAAEIGAAEAGNALYVVQVNAAGEGPLGTVRVRFKVPGTNDYREHAWPLDYDGAPKPLEDSSYTLRLAGTASAFSEWLVSSPYAAEVTTDRLLTILSGVPEHFEPDPRPKKLEWMIRQAKSVAGK